MAFYSVLGILMGEKVELQGLEMLPLYSGLLERAAGAGFFTGETETPLRFSGSWMLVGVKQPVGRELE